MTSPPCTGLSCVGCNRGAGYEVDEALPFPLVPGARFLRREVTVAAGAWLNYVDAQWSGAMVVVEKGEIDLWCSPRNRRRFGAGAVLFFDGLGLVALHNSGLVDTLLVALSRRS